MLLLLLLLLLRLCVEPYHSAVILAALAASCISIAQASSTVPRLSDHGISDRRSTAGRCGSQRVTCNETPWYVSK